MQWNYVSPLKVFECIERLSNPDVGRVDELNFFRVEITKISNSQMHLVYKGRRFSKDMRTEFLLSFSANTDSAVTMITVAFQRDVSFTLADDPDYTHGRIFEIDNRCLPR